VTRFENGGRASSPVLHRPGMRRAGTRSSSETLMSRNSTAQATHRSLNASKPPDLRHFRAVVVSGTAGLENYKKGGWHRAQDDLSWQAQNLGSGGGTQTSGLSSNSAVVAVLGPGSQT
jgi:hypothetical protein